MLRLMIKMNTVKLLSSALLFQVCLPLILNMHRKTGLSNTSSDYHCYYYHYYNNYGC